MLATQPHLAPPKPTYAHSIARVWLEGCVEMPGSKTVSVATELVMLPPMFVTTTS